MLNMYKIVTTLCAFIITACGSNTDSAHQGQDREVENTEQTDKSLTEKDSTAILNGRNPNNSENESFNKSNDSRPGKKKPIKSNNESLENESKIVFGGGVTVGNGGDALICANPNKEKRKSVRLLDYYEAEYRWGLTLSLGNDSLSISEKVDLILTRLARLDPARAKRYRQQITEFNDDSNFWPGMRLADIDDAQTVGIPSGCRLSQLARQYKPDLRLDKYYVVSKDLFDSLNKDHQIGLIFHEIIYREFIEQGHTTSNQARYFNALIASKEFGRLSLKAYIEELKTAKLPFVYQGQYSIDIYDDLRFSHSQQSIVMARSSQAIPPSATAKSQIS